MSWCADSLDRHFLHEKGLIPNKSGWPPLETRWSGSGQATNPLLWSSWENLLRVGAICGGLQAFLLLCWCHSRTWCSFSVKKLSTSSNRSMISLPGRSTLNQIPILSRTWMTVGFLRCCMQPAWYISFPSSSHKMLFQPSEGKSLERSPMVNFYPWRTWTWIDISPLSFVEVNGVLTIKVHFFELPCHFHIILFRKFNDIWYFPKIWSGNPIYHLSLSNWFKPVYPTGVPIFRPIYPTGSQYFRPI